MHQLRFRARPAVPSSAWNCAAAFAAVARLALLFTAALVAGARAQQPNTPQASLTVNGAAGPPYPILVEVQKGSAATTTIQGAGASSAHPAGQPLAIYHSVNGQLQPGAASAFGGMIDLPLSPLPVPLLDTATDPMVHTDPVTGTLAVVVTVPAALPTGSSFSIQGIIFDPVAAGGWRLTAATRASIVPAIVNLNTGTGSFGNSGGATIALSPFNFTLPFYGHSYSIVHLSGDGYLTFGGNPVPDDTPSDIDLQAGPPRIAGFWTDLDQAPGQVVRYRVDSNPGVGLGASLQVEFVSVGDAGPSPNSHTFRWTIDATGFISIVYAASNAPPIADVLCGIGPGQGLAAAPMRDLSTLLAPNSFLGAINASLYEWFGTSGNPNYTPGQNRPYDLAGRTVNFLPLGAGSLPAQTYRYAIY